MLACELREGTYAIRQKLASVPIDDNDVDLGKTVGFHRSDRNGGVVTYWIHLIATPSSAGAKTKIGRQRDVRLSRGPGTRQAIRKRKELPARPSPCAGLW